MADTDPDIQAQIDAALGAQKAPARSVGADVDPDIAAQVHAQLVTPAAPNAPQGSASRAIPSDAVPGAYGLMWRPSGGGYDPKTGEAVMSGKEPGKDQGILATASGVVNGLPVVGPWLSGKVLDAGASMEAARTGADPAYVRQALQTNTQNAQAAHPNLTTAGNVVGGVAGAVPLAEAAPAAFGMAGTLPMRIAGGAGGGAALNAADAWSRSEDPLKAAAVGAGFGAAIPVAGNAISSGINSLANVANGGVDGISRAAARHLLPAIEADTPAAVAANNARLGPNGMLLDAGQALLGKAQGAALNSDDARSVLNGALLARDAGTNSRLASDVNGALGPAVSPQAASDALQNARSQIHSHLPAIFASAPPVDTTGVLANIGQGLNKAVGPEATVLGKARDWLMETRQNPDGSVSRIPVSDPQKLQNAKMAIDTLIDRGDPSLGVQPGAVAKSQGSIGAVRQQLNQALRDQVPGYSHIMDASSALASRMESIEKGNSILGAGQNALSPADLNTQLAASAAKGLGPISPVVNDLQGLRVGARGAIDRAMGTKANDLVALRNAMQGEGGWNADKLATIFGQGPANDVANSIDQNSAFRNSLNKVVENSQTAQRTAAKEAMKPGAENGGIPLLNPNMTATGLVMTPVKKMAAALLDQFRPDPTRSYGEIGRVLSAQGPQRDAYYSALVDALQRRGQGAAVANALGPRAAMASALLGGRAVSDQYGRQ